MQTRIQKLNFGLTKLVNIDYPHFISLSQSSYDMNNSPTIVISEFLNIRISLL